MSMKPSQRREKIDFLRKVCLARINGPSSEDGMMMTHSYRILSQNVPANPKEVYMAEYKYLVDHADHYLLITCMLAETGGSIETFHSNLKAYGRACQSIDTLVSR